LILEGRRRRQKIDYNEANMQTMKRFEKSDFEEDYEMRMNKKHIQEVSESENELSSGRENSEET